MSQTYETILEPHVRGRTLKRLTTLAEPWLGTSFPGGIKFTLRTEITQSGIGDDRDAVAQATAAGGEITSVGNVVTVELAPRRSRGWPLGVLYWDLVGIVNADEIHTIDSGTIEIVGAVTKAT